MIEAHAGSIYDQQYDLKNLLDLSTRTQKVRAKAESLIGEGAANKLWNSIQCLSRTKTGQFMLDMTGLWSSRVKGMVLDKMAISDPDDS